jgi:hypothetical protein
MYAICFFLLIFCGIIGAVQLCAWMYESVITLILRKHRNLNK